MTGDSSPAWLLSASQDLVLEALPYAVVVTDAVGVIGYCNSAAERLYGYRREDLLGAPVEEMLVPAEEQGHGERIMEQVVAGDPWSGVFPVACGDGRTRLVRIVDAPVLLGDTVVGVVGVADDVASWAQAAQDQERAQRQMAQMAAVALAMGAVETVEDLVGVVIREGLATLDADGGAVAVRDDAAGLVRLTIGDTVSEHVRADYAEVPLGSHVPAAYVARTGEPLLFPTLAEAVAWDPFIQVVSEQTGRRAWATVPLRAGNRLIGALVVGWQREHELTSTEHQLLDVFAAQCAQALDRIQATVAERKSAAAAKGLSEALQRSLLTRPTQSGQLNVAVRYRPATEAVQVGGDWYDCFRTSARGDTLLVIGDVNGHDRTAAAAMGQLRNLLRGLSYHSEDSPAALLSQLDDAMHGLEVETLATALVGRITHRTHSEGTISVELTWSNAGHLPALVRHPGGGVRVLRAEADLMLGIDPMTPRRDHVISLPPGATLLLYTDGLVERRGQDLDDGVAWLVEVLQHTTDLTADELCDRLLTLTQDTGREDDIALLVLQT